LEETITFPHKKMKQHHSSWGWTGL